MTERVKIGLVGVGRWGKCYVSTIAQMDDVQLAVAVSRNPETRQLLAADCRIVEDWQVALAAGGLDGLVVATPPASHHAIASACIDLGLPVLVEKPITLSLSQARDLELKARQRGSLVMVNHTHLFSSAYQTLKSRVAEFERPLQICSLGGSHGPFRDDTDALWDYAPHDIALCLDLVGAEPVSLQAQSLPSQVPNLQQGMLINANMVFADGSQAEITVGNQMLEKQRVFSVQSSEQRLVYDDLADAKLVEYDAAGPVKRFALSSALPLTRAVRAFAEAIATGQGQHSSLGLSLQVTAILEKISGRLNELSRPADISLQV